MKSFISLPSGFKEILSIDLQKDKKTALLINLSSLAAAIVMFVAAMVFRYEEMAVLFDPHGGFMRFFGRLAALLAGLIVYMLLHELVHGIAMRICGTKNVSYGFTGLYAFAGSDDLYDRSGYIFIALAPIVVWGVVLAVICAVVPKEWFWAVYILQTANISGAAGDIYVTVRFMRLPKDILVRDTGVSMTVYSAGVKADGED